MSTISGTATGVSVWPYRASDGTAPAGNPYISNSDGTGQATPAPTPAPAPAQPFFRPTVSEEEIGRIAENVAILSERHAEVYALQTQMYTKQAMLEERVSELETSLADHKLIATIAVIVAAISIVCSVCVGVLA